MADAAKHICLAARTARDRCKAAQPLGKGRAGHAAACCVDGQAVALLSHGEIGGRRGAEPLKVWRLQIGVVGRMAVPVDLGEA